MIIRYILFWGNIYSILKLKCSIGHFKLSIIPNFQFVYFYYHAPLKVWSWLVYQFVNFTITFKCLYLVYCTFWSDKTSLNGNITLYADDIYTYYCNRLNQYCPPSQTCYKLFYMITCSTPTYHISRRFMTIQ